MKIFLTPVITLLYLMLSILTGCQSFSYKKPDRRLTDSFLKISVPPIPPGAAEAVNYLPSGYTKSGKVNYTAQIQKAIDENSFIVMPDFPVLIDRRGLKVRSGKTLVFRKNSLIRFEGPAVGKYWDVLKIYNSKNVRIVNAVIEGSRNSTLPQSGEWSAGISVLNSDNVIIENPKIYNTYGDGIFIGSEDGGVSENIYVKGGWIDNVRRNGISITSGRNVFLSNILISNTNGTAPEAGIDIEPSIEPEFIENVNLDNIYTFNNKVSGIAVNLNALSTARKDAVKKVTINIRNHTDNGSAYALGTSLNENPALNDVEGEINIISPVWMNSRNGLYWKSPTRQRIKIRLENINSPDQGQKKTLEAQLRKESNFTVK